MLGFLIFVGVAALGGGAYYLKRSGAFSAKPPLDNLPLGAREFTSLATPGPAQKPALPKSGIGHQYDAIIADIARREGISPVLLKAIVAKETYFDEEAVNPEQTFTLGGVTYPPSSNAGRQKLREFISRGGDPATIGLNPSLGLAQVRVRTGKHFIPGLDAVELFDPKTNLTASARLLRELLGAGITLDTIDAYNVGQDLHPRNFPYRDKVKQFFAQFQGDF